MLFQSSVNQTIQRLFSGASQNASNQRKTEAAKRLDYYHDTQIAHLEAQLSDLVSDPDELTPCFVNIVRKVINLLAMVYVQEATRTVEGTERDGEIFAEISQQSALPVKMKLASRYTKLLKTVLLRPVWRNNRLDIDVLTGNVLDVETGDSPEDMRAVMVTHYGQSNRVDEIEYSLWTPDSWRRLDYRGLTLEHEANPYPILPYIPCWDRSPTDGFWLPGGDDLVVLQEALNLKLTDLLYTIRFQGFGVGWVSGAEKSNQPGDPEFTVGPGRFVTLPDGGKLGYANTNAPIEEIVGAIDWLLKQAAVSNGLPASSLSTEPTDESGLSKLVSNRELDELRRDDIALWRGYEHRLFDVIRAVWNVHSPTKQISDAATLKVDFADPQPAVSPKEQSEQWEKLISMGVINAVDIMLERNPDLKTRENAIAALLKLQSESAELGEQTI